MNTKSILRLGVDPRGKSFEDVLRLANLNWVPLEAPCGALGDDLQTARFCVPDRKVLYRSDTQEPLGVVGSRFRPFVPAQFVERQMEIADEIGGELVSVGFIGKKAKAFAFIRLRNDISLKTPLRQQGDILNLYIFSTDGWNGGTARQSSLYVERLICSNGMTSRVLQSGYWTAHTQKAGERLATLERRFLEEVKSKAQEVEQVFQRLASSPMSREEAEKFFLELLPGDHLQRAHRRQQLMHLFTSGIGNSGQTRYDALNAVTEYITHHRRYRAEWSHFSSVVEEDPLRTRALELLMRN